jgi:hypothetical protein
VFTLCFRASTFRVLAAQIANVIGRKSNIGKLKLVSHELRADKARELDVHHLHLIGTCRFNQLFFIFMYLFNIQNLNYLASKKRNLTEQDQVFSK